MGKLDYYERKERRLERCETLATKNEHLSLLLYDEAKKMQNVIPFGQPVITGHYSEKRDRNFRQRIHNKYGKSFEAGDKAKYYKEKVSTIESNRAISSDDPEAVQRLKEKIEGLESNQNLMKEANRIIKSSPRNERTDKKIENLESLGLKCEQAEMLFKADFCGRIGFSSYALQNNNANSRRCKQRLEYLQNIEKMENSELEYNNIKIVQDVEDNRTKIYFPDKSTAMLYRDKLKRSGFRWSRYNGTWQRHLSNQALWAAKEIIGIKDL